MLNKLKASTKLYMLIFIMSAFVIEIGAYGVIELRKMYQNTQTIYADRVLPMAQLTNIRFAYEVSLFSITRQVTSHTISYTEANRQIQKTEAAINRNWKAYMLTYLTPEEDKLAKQAAVLMQQSAANIQKLKAILVKENTPATDSFINKSLTPPVSKTVTKMNQLIDLQVKVGAQIYKNSESVYNNAVKKFFFLIVVSLSIAIFFCYYIVRNIKYLIINLLISNKRIAESEKKYRDLLEHAGDPIILLNEDTSFNEVNTSAVKLLGYSQEEFSVMKFSDVLVPEETGESMFELGPLLANNALLVERRLLRKDHTEVEVEVNARVLEDKGYLAIARDITERKRIEDTVRESERKYRNIFENVQDVFYQTNLEGIILDVSPSAKYHTGYTREELIGSHVFNLYYDYADREKAFNLMLKTGTLKDYELTFKSNLGEAINVLLNVTLIKGNNGVPSHMDGSFKNITGRKKIEAELAQHKEQLALFIEHSPASLAMFDNQMRYIATSRRWINDYNVGTQELIGSSHYEIFPEIPQRWKDIHQHCLNGAVEKNEDDLFTRADGSIDRIRWEIHPWHRVSGEIGGIIMFTEVITEQRKATELFKYQFENSPDIILVIDSGFKIETINRGIPGGLAVTELIGMDCIAILPTESQEAAREAIINCFETGLNQEVEHALRFENWVRSRFVPLIFNDTIPRVMIISTDITQNRKAEEKLRQSEEKHRALIENITDTIILINKNAGVIYQSPSFIRTAGFEMDSLENKTIFDFVHPDDIQNCRSVMQLSQALPSEPQHFQFRIIHKDGHYIWIEGTISNLLYNESVNAFIVIYRDITERKKAEQNLLQSEARLKEAQAIAGIGNWEIDMVNNIHTWSDEIYEIYGINSGDVEPSTEILLSFMHPDDQPFARDEIRQAFETLAASSSNFRFIRMDGALRYGQIEWRFEFDKLNNPIRLYGILQDITDRKIAEQEREKMTADIIQRNTDLEQFAYIVSHNLRAPVANILGIANLIKTSEMDTGEQEQMMEALSTNVKKLDDVIIDLNYILQIKREVSEKKEMVRLPDLLGDIKLSIANLIEKEQVLIESDFAAVDEILALKSYLQSIFFNLISNSIKYRQPGVPPQIKITSTLATTKITLTFKDNGLGIDLTRNREQIFGLYKRFHYHTDGKGMGLYMVKTQVETLGGKISIQSEVNKGTEFKIEFETSPNAGK